MNFKLKLLQHLLRDESAGLTIIEGLLAIIVVTILIMAIGPVLAFAAATRIQARRVELASQAATAYLDGVRSGTIPPPPITAPPTGTIPPSQTLSKINAPPAGALTCNTANDYCTAPTAANYKLYCVDRNGNGRCSSSDPTDRKDFVIQAARVGPTNGSDLLGIRVYRADAFGKNLILKTSQQGVKKVGTLTAGQGNLLAPMVEMTTEIPAS